MSTYLKKTSLFLLIVFALTVVFFSDFSQASFWDTIKAWVTINPLSVDVSTPKEVEIDKVFKVEARAINRGEEKIENGEAEILLPSGLVLLEKDAVKKIGVIPGEKEKKILWSVKGEQIGDYFISVKVSGKLRGELITAESGTIKVSVAEKISPGRFDFLREIFERWFRF